VNCNVDRMGGRGSKRHEGMLLVCVLPTLFGNLESGELEVLLTLSIEKYPRRFRSTQWNNLVSQGAVMETNGLPNDLIANVEAVALLILIPLFEVYVSDVWKFVDRC
jgi:hypothetical protein